MQELMTGTVTDIRPIQQDLFTKWASYIDAAPKTIESYKRSIKQFANYLQEHNIAAPARADVLAYRDYLKLNHKPTTVQAYITAVKLFFQWTAQENIYPNIADHVKGAKLDNEHKKDYLTKGQITDTLDKIDRTTLQGKRDYAILSLMVTSGLRTIEIVRANIEDLRTVADFAALYIQGKGHVEKTVYIKLAKPIEDAIRDYLKARGKADDKSPLFISIANRNSGGRLTTRSVSRLVKEHLIAVGLNSDRLTAHSLRHTAATLNLLAGGTIEETRQLLRHTNINTTLIYSHALERAKNNSEDRIAACIFSQN